MALPGTQLVASNHDVRASLNFLMTSVLSAHIRRLVLSCSVVSALRVLPVVAGVHFQWFVV